MLKPRKKNQEMTLLLSFWFIEYTFPEILIFILQRHTSKYIQYTVHTTYLSISKTVQHGNQEALEKDTHYKSSLMWMYNKQQETLSQVCDQHYWSYLERAEGEVDEVPGVTTAALHTFIYQHSEDHFMDSQQRNQYQCCSGQADRA